MDLRKKAGIDVERGGRNIGDFDIVIVDMAIVFSAWDLKKQKLANKNVQ